MSTEKDGSTDATNEPIESRLINAASDGTVIITPKKVERIRRILNSKYWDGIRNDNAEMRSRIDAALARIAELEKANTKLIERSVGAMAIAEGDEGHEKIPRDCPMLVAVSELRNKYEGLEKELSILNSPPSQETRVKRAWVWNRTLYTVLTNEGDLFWKDMEPQSNDKWELRDLAMLPADIELLTGPTFDAVVKAFEASMKKEGA